MDEEQKPSTRRVSLGFILSFLLVIGLIGVMIYFFFFNNTTVTLKEDLFAYYVNNNQVTEVVVTEKEQTVVAISGKYLKEKGNPKTTTAFKTVVTYSFYHDTRDFYCSDKLGDKNIWSMIWYDFKWEKDIQLMHNLN